MAAPHCDKTSSGVGRFRRALTVGLAWMSSAARGQRDTQDASRDSFERRTAPGLRRSLQNDARPLLPMTVAASTGQAWQPDTPKVALAFLSMGHFPQEETWRHWFEAAHNFVALAPLQRAGCRPEMMAEAVRTVPPGTPTPNPIAHQELFSVYVHVPEDTHYSAESMFAPYVIDTHHKTAWGAHTITEAMRATLAKGLEEARNQVFITVSDDALPLHPPTAFYQSALHFPVSRINACLGGERTSSRWHAEMAIRAATPVTEADWRKSSQWFQLKRAHVARLVADAAISRTFRDYCYEDASHPPCASDEHYPATALSMLGHASETDCRGTIMYTDWRDGGAHPYTFTDDDIEPEAMDRMAAPSECYPWLAQQLASYGFVEHGIGAAAAHEACESAPAWPVGLLGAHCPLLARKFSKSADPAAARWMRHMLRRSSQYAAYAAQPDVRAQVLENAWRMDAAVQAPAFPEAGCAASRRDYVWPRGVFMDFACPPANVAGTDLIEALRCYAETPVCEPVIAQKRRFFSVDTAFVDTLEGEAAMNDGVRLMRSLRESDAPARHNDVSAGVMAELRESRLSVPYYLEEFEIIGTDQQVDMLSTLWFETSTAPDRRDERYVLYAAMLGRMLRNPAALESMLRQLFAGRMQPFALPDPTQSEFSAALPLADAIARAVAPVTRTEMSAAIGNAARPRGPAPVTLGQLVQAIGRRLERAGRVEYDIGWLKARADGFEMLAAVMVTLAQDRDTPEALARAEALEMASDPMQVDQAHRRVGSDVAELIAIARSLATRAQASG